MSDSLPMAGTFNAKLLQVLPKCISGLSRLPAQFLQHAKASLQTVQLILKPQSSVLVLLEHQQVTS